MDMFVPKILFKLERAVLKAIAETKEWTENCISQEYNYGRYVEEFHRCIEYKACYDFGHIEYSEEDKFSSCCVTIIAHNYVSGLKHEFSLEVPDKLYELLPDMPGCDEMPVYTVKELARALGAVYKVIFELKYPKEV